MSGILRLFGLEFECAVVERDDALHAEGDDQQDGIVKFDEAWLAIASQESLDEMRRAAMHETIHVMLRQNPALMLAFRSEIAESDLEHWINSMSASLVEVFQESEWVHDYGAASLLPDYWEADDDA